MASLSALRIAVGFGLKLFGIVWAILDKVICNSLCSGNCSAVQSNTCSLLLMFVGIIFIVVGFVLVVMKDKQRMNLKKKIKKNIELVKK